MEKPPKRKPNLLMRVLLLLSGLAMAVIAVSLVAFRDQLNLDALRRWVTYRSMTLSDSGQAEPFRCGGANSDIYLDLDGDLLVCTDNSICLWSQSGTQYIDQAVNMAAPAVHAKAGSAVVYDAGGTQLFVFRQRALAFSMQSESPLLSVRLNSSGHLTVVSQQPGARCTVTVYHSGFQRTAAMNLSSAVMDAQLSADGRTLAVVTVSQTDGEFTSSILLYDLSQLAADGVSRDAVPFASCTLGRNVVLDLEQSGDRLWALGDGGLFVVDDTAAVLGSANWSNRYLKACTLGGDGFAVALLGKYRAGTQAELSVVDDTAALVGSLSLDEQVLSVSAAGRYFAVLTTDRLDIYTKDMELYSSLQGTSGARKVLLRSDGTAFLISSGAAQLYVPA